MGERLLKRKEAAELLSCSLVFLAKDAMKDQPLIPFVKISSRFVRYRMSDLNTFMSNKQAN